MNLRYAGQYFDAETDLHQNWWRSYSSGEGRYITPDPIGLNDGINTYGYVGGNPARYYDLSGLERWDFDGYGDTSSCFYYDRMARENPSCGYYREAARICRGAIFP